MSEILSRKQTFRELIIFALPLIAGQLGLMLIGAGDMLIATQHSTTALAAIGLAVAFANPVFVVGLAFQFALSPLIAKRRGEGRDTDHLALSAIFYALILSGPFMVMTYIAAHFVPLLGYSPELTEMVVSYVKISTWSIPGAFIYTSLREWLQAHERTMWPNAVSIIAVGLNLFVNWVFVFGHYGFPSLGVDGLAWASTLVRWVMGIALLVPLLPTLIRFKKADRPFIRDAFILGGPTALAMFFEVMAFCSVTMFVGKFGELQTAANNLVLTLASCTFMIPMALSSAVGVKVGHAFGEKNKPMIKRFAWTGLICSIGFMACAALTFAIFPKPVFSIFGSEPAVVVYGVRFLFWVSLFQVFDGAQVTLGAILRGLGISRPVSVITFIGYWLIGIPLGWYLGNRAGYEGQGFWISLTISLALVAVCLMVLTVKKVAQATK